MSNRYVLHIDLDCFYAQVEMRRLGVPYDHPFVTTQWGSILAVSYAARPFGITRMDNIKEALSKCPQLKHCHVATFGPNDTISKYYESPNKGTHKACLASYRNASKKIFETFEQTLGSTAVFEKGGIDEVFIDVSARVAQEEKRLGETSETNDAASLIDWDDWSTWCSFLGPVEKDVGLYIASSLCRDVRQRVRADTGFECSAGVSCNKLLAKIVSATHKPNQQTVLFSSHTLEFLKGMKFRKLRGLGGKAGEVMSSAGYELCGQVWDVSIDDIRRLYAQQLKGTGKDMEWAGVSAQFVYNSCRGIDDTPVKPRLLPKSLMAAKRLSGSSACESLPALVKWGKVLSSELCDRIKQHGEDHPQNAPQSLRVSVNFGKVVRTVVLPDPPTPELVGQVVANTLSSMFTVLSTSGGEAQRDTPARPAIWEIAVSAVNFQAAGPSSGASGSGGAQRRRIDEMFKKREAPKAEYSGAEQLRGRDTNHAAADGNGTTTIDHKTSRESSPLGTTVLSDLSSVSLESDMESPVVVEHDVVVVDPTVADVSIRAPSVRKRPRHDVCRRSLSPDPAVPLSVATIASSNHTVQVDDTSLTPIGVVAPPPPPQSSHDECRGGKGSVRSNPTSVGLRALQRRATNGHEAPTSGISDVQDGHRGAATASSCNKAPSCNHAGVPTLELMWLRARGRGPSDPDRGPVVEQGVDDDDDVIIID